MFHFLKKHFNTVAFMSECLPTVTDIESVDCCITGSQTLSYKSNEVLQNSAYLLLVDSPGVKMISGDGFLYRWAVVCIIYVSKKSI